MIRTPPFLLAIIDGFGVYGYYFHYGMILFFVGSAFIIFIHLWRKVKLGMDEEAKLQMMELDEVWHKEKKDE